MQETAHMIVLRNLHTSNFKKNLTRLKTFPSKKNPTKLAIYIMIFHSNATLYSNSSITTDLTSRPTNWTTEGNPEKIILESQVHMNIYKHLFHKQSSIAIFTVQTVPELQIMQECFYIPSQLSKVSGKQQFQLIRVPKPCIMQ